MDLIRHYDKLIEENNDPVRDSKPLREHMDKWDGLEFIEKLNLSQDKSVLEIGVGTGRLAVRTAPLCKRFLGIDISPKTIERAKENLSAYSNVQLVCGDFLTYKISETFDVIYSSLTFMHIKEKHTALSKVASCLSDNGIFALSIDKNQDEYIDMGDRKIKIYPDEPDSVKRNIIRTGLTLTEQYETEFAHIFICSKTSRS